MTIGARPTITTSNRTKVVEDEKRQLRANGTIVTAEAIPDSIPNPETGVLYVKVKTNPGITFYN